MLDGVKRVANNPKLLIVHLFQHKPFSDLISDEKYLKLYYKTYLGTELDLVDPKGFNAKLQWLKLYDRRPEYVDLTDKYKVREYVSKKIGNEHLVPLLGCWSNVEQIPYSELPNQFVLKCNHDSGSVVICKDKNSFNIASANRQLKKALEKDYYLVGREYNYHDIERRIIAEKYLSNEANGGLTDYKFFCFDGKPEFIQVDTGRFSNHIRNFYSMDWDFIDVAYGKPNSPDCPDEKPDALDEMSAYARILSEGLPHVRVDFYYSNGVVLFGEMTFHHGGGAMTIDPPYYDELWGSYLTLPAKTV